MNYFKFNLNLRHWMLLGAFCILGACSFRKEPLPTTDTAIKIKQTDTLSDYAESVMLNSSEDEFIELLEGRKKEQVENIRFKDKSLLDLSIIHSKIKVLDYLLKREINPLNLNDDSRRVLEKNALFKGIVTSFQKPYFFKIISQLKRLVEEDSLRIELENLKLYPASCRIFLDLAFDMYTYEPTTESSFAVPNLDKDNGPVLIKEIFKISRCSNLRESISSEDIQRWLSGELLIQAQKNFTDMDFTKFLIELKPIENFHLDTYHYGKKKRLDPRLVVLAKIDWEEPSEIENRQKWVELLSKVTSKDKFYYNHRYIPCEEVPSDSEAAEPMCIDYIGTQMALEAVQNIFNIDNKKRKREAINE